MKTKFTISFMLLALFAGQALSQGGTPTCATTAIQNFLTSQNADYKEISTEESYESITANQSPSNSFDENKVCGKIWKQTGGTCCPQDKVEQRVQKLIRKQKARLVNRYKKVKRGYLMILKGLNRLKTFLNSRKDQIIARNTANQQEGADQATITKWIRSIDALLAKATNDESRGVKAAGALKQCMKAIVDTRIKFWCAVCSAQGGNNSIDFWNGSTNKVKVARAVCDTFVDNCGAVISFIRRLRKADRLLRKIRKALFGRLQNGATDDKPEIPDTDVDKDTDCGDDTAACKNDDTKRRHFCLRMYLNKDDEESWGDNKVLENTVDNLESSNTLRMLRGIERMIQSNDSSAGSMEETSQGGLSTNLDAGTQVDTNTFNDPDTSNNSFGKLANFGIALLSMLFLYIKM